MQRRPWIVLGSLTGLVACPTLVALTAVLVRDLRGPVFSDRGMPALIVSGAVGIALGAFVASRMVRVVTSRRLALLGVVSGAVLGAAATGSLTLVVVVAGDGWPNGLSVFLTGALIGAVLGGFLGGVLGFVQGDPSGAERPAPASAGQPRSASLRDVR